MNLLNTTIFYYLYFFVAYYFTKINDDLFTFFVNI